MLNGFSSNLIIDRVSTGGLGNIWEQILGTGSTRNQNETATNALIEYCIVQGYQRVTFRETNAAPFVDDPADNEYNAGGKQVITDIIARFTAAGIQVGIQIVDFAGARRIADYNATCAAYEKISFVYWSDDWWDLTRDSTDYEDFRDDMIDALTDGAGPTQVDWTAAGGRLPWLIDIGDTRTWDDAFADTAITYDQLCDLSESLQAAMMPLLLCPNDPSVNAVYTVGAGYVQQKIVFDIRCDHRVPNYSTIRSRVWKLLTDGGIFKVFYDTGSDSMECLFINVSPETPVSNTTDATDTTRHYAGYFFEGRALPSTPPTSDPAVVRNRKDPYDAYVYAAYDITASIAECNIPVTGDPFGVVDPPVPRYDMSAEQRFTLRRRYIGDMKDAWNSRLPLSLVYTGANTSTPYEDIITAVGLDVEIYCYGFEKFGLLMPSDIEFLQFPALGYTDYQWANPGDPWTRLNFDGITIRSQYVMRKFTTSLVHGPVTIDIPAYLAADTPDYTGKYTFVPTVFTAGAPPFSGVQAAPAPFGSGVGARLQIPYGTNYIPPFSGGAISAYFVHITDQITTLNGQGSRFWWLESVIADYGGVDWTNPNAPDSTFVAPIGMQNTVWGPVARFAVSRDGKALAYYTGHGTTEGFAPYQFIGLDADTYVQGFFVETLPEPVIVGILDWEDPLCFAAANGTAEAYIVSGADTRGPMTWQWYLGDPDNGGVALPGQTTPILTNVQAGNYWVKMTAADTVTYSTAQVILDHPELLEIAFEAKQDICNGNPTGAIYLGVDGGTKIDPPAPYDYVYAWSGPGGFTASTPIIENLDTPGIYTLLVTDANGCTATESWEILEIITPSITLAVNGLLSTCPGSDIDIAITSPNWVLFERVEWSTGDIDVGVITITAPGTYSVVGWIGTCTSYAEIVVPAAAALSASVVAQQNLVCGSATPGYIEVEAAGGCAPYTYSWVYPDLSVHPGQNQYGLTQEGTYVLTVTDAALNEFELEVELETEVFSLLVAAPEFVCAGSFIDFTIEPDGGQAPYTYVMNAAPAGAVITNNGSYATISNASPGAYGFIVTDANGCVSTQGVNLVSTYPITVTITGTDSDFGADNGTASLSSVTGGTGTYVNYAWTGPNGYSSSGASLTRIYNLAPGVYKLTVTDDNDCTGWAYVTISQGLSTYNAEIERAECCFGELTTKLLTAMRIGDKKALDCLKPKFERIADLIRAMRYQMTIDPTTLVVDPDPDRQPLVTPTECLTDEEKINLINLAREICTECNGDC